jgi:hypothetical protein
MACDRARGPHCLAPARLLAIHAIELYLNALLLGCGDTARDVRGLQHDLARRTERAQELGLSLRAKTATHLDSLASTREYLTARYGPEMSATWSQLNRLTASLEEVGKKVTLILDQRRATLHTNGSSPVQQSAIATANRLDRPVVQ